MRANGWLRGRQPAAGTGTVPGPATRRSRTVMPRYTHPGTPGPARRTPTPAYQEAPTATMRRRQFPLGERSRIAERLLLTSSVWPLLWQATAGSRRASSDAAIGTERAHAFLVQKLRSKLQKNRSGYGRACWAGAAVAGPSTTRNSHLCRRECWLRPQVRRAFRSPRGTASLLCMFLGHLACH